MKRLTVTTLTLRRIKGHFVVTGPDIPPMQFKSRPEAKDWCKAHFPSSPITRGSFRLDAGRPDHLGPLLGFVRDELAEVGGGTGKNRTA